MYGSIDEKIDWNRLEEELSYYLQQLINSLSVGSIYALIALGYTMVYGIIKLINFAHGDILMMGSYFGYVMGRYMGLSFLPSVILAMVFCALAGVLIDKIAYLPLRNAPRLSPLITALAVSIFIQNLFRTIFGPQTMRMPELLPNMANIQIGEIYISSITAIVFIVSVICMVTLNILVKFTKMGRAMRAVSEDQGAAQLMGVNVNHTISMTFAIGSALAAVGGVLLGLTYQQVSPMMGSMPGLKAFVAAVIGGIGIIPGAMIGGYVIGLVETFAKISPYSSWADAIVFLILIIVLIFKPSGILGKNVKEKV